MSLRLATATAAAAAAAVTVLIAGGGAAQALAAGPPAPPMALPGDASSAGVRSDRDSWIVAARPSPAARATAGRFGARALGPAAIGAYVLPRGQARPFAAALRSRRLLVYAEPNRLSHPLAVADDPLSGPPNAWRDFVVDPALDPPAVTADSPLIALVDSRLEDTHPEFTGDNVGTLGGIPVTNAHGTATAAVAAAPKNDIGMLGVWPGARALNVPLPDEISCADSARQILRAIAEGASVINMSYGSRSPCFAEYQALQFAIVRGVVPVAAAGNEFADGNPVEFPASLPHVLTVASVGADKDSSYFSSSSAAIDLSAPGEGILTAVPLGMDVDDGTPDGYEKLSGTSFSAPMAAAAAAWVQADRPELTNDQVAQILRLSAEDLGNEGWDADTGFGLLSVGAALERRPPPPDPTEPNDEMIWIDGRAFSQPDKPVFDGRRSRRFSASLDRFEDPADVYRIRIGARSRARVLATPSFGNPELAGYKGGARSLGSRRLARSRRGGEHTESITLRNRSRRKRTFYVALTVQGDSRSLDAGYRLTVKP